MERWKVGLREAVGAIRREIREVSEEYQECYWRDPYIENLKRLAISMGDENVRQQFRDSALIREKLSHDVYSDLRRFLSGREEAELQLSVEPSGFRERFREVKLKVSERGWGTAEFGFRGRVPIIDFIRDPVNTDEARLQEIRDYLNRLESQPLWRRVQVIGKAALLGDNIRLGDIVLSM